MKWALGWVFLAGVMVACGGGSEEDEVKSLVERTFDVINEGDTAALWDTLCPSLRGLIPQASYETAMKELYEDGEVHASGLRFHYVDVQDDVGEVRYDIDLVAAGNTTHRTETYAVRKQSGEWCYEMLVSRE
jgi:hypothetical protein